MPLIGHFCCPLLEIQGWPLLWVAKALKYGNAMIICPLLTRGRSSGGPLLRSFTVYAYPVVCLLYICVHVSSYALVINRNAFNKGITSSYKQLVVHNWHGFFPAGTLIGKVVHMSVLTFKIWPLFKKLLGKSTPFCDKITNFLTV